MKTELRIKNTFKINEAFIFKLNNSSIFKESSKIMIKSFISKDFKIKKLPWVLITIVGLSSKIILDEAIVNEQLIMKFVSKSRMFPGAIKIIFWGSD